MARPKLKVDPQQIERLASIGCNNRDIAYAVGMSEDTLYRRFAAPIAKGQASLRNRLRLKMWDAIDRGNITMMIFLSKQYLGFADKIELGAIADSVLMQEIQKRLRGSDNAKDVSRIPATPGTVPTEVSEVLPASEELLI